MRSALALALLVASAWSAGAPVAAARAESVRSSIPIRLTLGLALCSALVAALALVGALQFAPWALALVALPSVARLVLEKNRVVRAWPRPRLVHAPLALFVAVALAVGATPIVEGDALTYEMPIVTRMVAEHHLAFWPGQWRSAFPMSHEVLASVVLLLGGGRPGVVTAFEIALAASLAVALARRWSTSEVDAQSAALIALGGVAPMAMACSLKPDLLLVDATLACALVTLDVEARDWKSAAIAGSLAGLMIGCKYTGAPIAAVLFAWLALRVRSAPAIAVASVGALVGGGYWYLHDWIVLGSPCPPYLAGLFRPLLSPVARADYFEHVASFGAGTTAVDLLAAPIRMFVQPTPFGGRGNLLCPLALLGLAAPIVQEQRRAALVLVGCFAASYVAWFWSLQNARLLLPAWALLAALSAGVLARVGAWSRWLRSLLVAGALSSGLASAAYGAVMVANAVADGPRYLARHTPSYDDIAWMNAHLDASSVRVASLVAPLGYLRVPWISLDPFIESEIAPEEMTDAARLRAALDRSGITHVYGPAAMFERPPWSGIRDESRVAYDDPAAATCGGHLFRCDPPEHMLLLARPLPTARR